MFTFLRRIHQKLIVSGSVTKYLLYAIGEILLVVIGILIALQVNNWNEERKLADEEQVILKALYDEVAGTNKYSGVRLKGRVVLNVASYQF